jgi:hypothetical protein|nr:MAG TPA: hypothetical protein [Caudoviricetes sp.]
MEYLKEANKNLIALRTSIIAVIIVLTGGIAGLILSRSFSLTDIVVLLIPGIYFDIVFLQNVLSLNDRISDNIRRMQNEYR